MMLSCQDEKWFEKVLMPIRLGSKLIPNLTMSPNGPPWLDPTDRDAQRTYVRDVLTQSYHDVMGEPNGVIPWTHPFRLVLRDGVMMIGWPLVRPICDPKNMSKAELWTLVCAAYEGVCYFREVSDWERTCLIEVWESGVSQRVYKAIPPRKKRDDEGVYRGRRLNPETTRKKKGGWISSPPLVPAGWDEDN